MQQPGIPCLVMIGQMLPASFEVCCTAINARAYVSDFIRQRHSVRAVSVWSPKCHCIGVNVTALIEMPASAPSSKSEVTGHNSDQAQGSFSDSLTAATQGLSQAGESKGAGVPVNGANLKFARAVKAVSDEAKASGSNSTSAGTRRTAAAQPDAQSSNQIDPTQTALLSNPVILPSLPHAIDAPFSANSQDADAEQSAQVSSDAATLQIPVNGYSFLENWQGITGAASGRVQGEQANQSQPAQPGVQLPVSASPLAGTPVVDTKTAAAAPLAQASQWSSSAPAVQGVNPKLNPFANAAQAPDALIGMSSRRNSHAVSVQEPPSGSPGSLGVTVASVDSTSPAYATQDATNAVNSPILNAIQNVLQNANTSATSNDLLGTSQTATASVTAPAPSDASPAATQGNRDNSASNAVQDALQGAVANPITMSEPQSTITNAGSNAASGSYSAAAVHATVNSPAHGAALPASGAVAGARPASQRDASSKVLPSRNGAPTDAPNQPAHTEIANQAARPQTSGVSIPVSATPEKPVAAVSGNAKDASTQRSNAADAKHDSQSAQGQAESQSSSQDAANSGSQNQPNLIPQDQSAAQTQVSFASHSAAAVSPTQTIQSGLMAQTATTQAGSSAPEAKPVTNQAQTSAAVPQAQPMINSARLIQTMSQSEMRVGMRSTEFGNISISTSSTKDAITAQISLDHGELAKAIAAHLPEIQARLGADQPVNVRVDMNGNAMGQGTGTQGGLSNGSADTSQGQRQQAQTGTNYGMGGVAEQQANIASAPLAVTASGGGNARLDITV